MKSCGVNLTEYPIDRLDQESGLELLERCRSQLGKTGVLILPGFLEASAVEYCVDQLSPIVMRSSFHHRREHNIYFTDHMDELSADHPALARMHTSSQTVCGDQLESTPLSQLYHWRPMIDFVAAVVGKERLYPMADPLAGLNVKAFRDGDVTNWHFDRAEFTVTLLLQNPISGGEFEIRRNLRSDEDPNYDGIAQFLAGEDKGVCSLCLEPGTLTIFRGKYSAHRVAPVAGDRPRMVVVLSYFDSSGVRFSDEDRMQFYGRTKSVGSMYFE